MAASFLDGTFTLQSITSLHPFSINKVANRKCLAHWELTTSLHSCLCNHAKWSFQGLGRNVVLVRHLIMSPLFKSRIFFRQKGNIATNTQRDVGKVLRNGARRWPVNWYCWSMLVLAAKTKCYPWQRTPSKQWMRCDPRRTLLIQLASNDKSAHSVILELPRLSASTYRGSVGRFFEKGSHHAVYLTTAKTTEEHCYQDLLQSWRNVHHNAFTFFSTT